MHVMFEVFLVPGSPGQNLLTQETIDDTQAQVMTREQAEKIGLSGIPDDPEGRERRFIVVRRSDQRRIQNWLDTHQEVTGFRVHDFDM